MNNNEILQKYEDFVCGRYSSKATRETFCIHPKVMLRWLDLPANDITQHELDKYLRYCLDTKKPNGNYIRFRCVKVFLEWLGKEVSVPYVKKVDAGKQALDDSELDKIFNTIESLTPLHRLVFYLEYDTIRRPSEIRKIKLNDRYGNTLRYSGKSGNVIGVKTCRMTQRLLDAWDDYVHYTRPLPMTPEDGEYLLLAEVNTRRGKRLLSNMMVTRVIKEVALHSKIEPPNGENPGNYLIKRTSITRQLKECPDPKIIQMQAGHQDLNTTMQYNRVRNEDIDKYLTKLEQDTKKDKDSPESLNKSSLSPKGGRRQQCYVLRYRLLYLLAPSIIFI